MVKGVGGLSYKEEKREPSWLEYERGPLSFLSPSLAGTSLCSLDPAWHKHHKYTFAIKQKDFF